MTRRWRSSRPASPPKTTLTHSQRPRTVRVPPGHDIDHAAQHTPSTSATASTPQTWRSKFQTGSNGADVRRHHNQTTRAILTIARPETQEST